MSACPISRGARTVRAAAVLTAGILAGCSPDRDSPAVDVVRTDSAGVELVSSPGVDRALPWSFDELLRLGGEDEGPASFTRVRRSNVGVDGAGNIYVLDSDAPRVVVFDLEGRHVRSMGGAGEGPGEMRFPLGMAVSLEGEADVFDVGKRALVAFGPGGAALDETLFPHSTDPGTHHFLVTDSKIYATRSVRPSDDRRALELISWGRSGTTDTLTLASQSYAAPEPVDYGCMGLAMRPFFEPVMTWAVSDSLVAVAARTDYRIDLFGSNGAFLRSIRRDIPPREATPEDAVREAGPGMRLMGERSCEISASELVEGRGYAETLPAIRDIRLGPDGWMWVERFEPGTPEEGESGPIDLFDPSGAYAGTLREEALPLHLAPGDRILPRRRTRWMSSASSSGGFSGRGRLALPEARPAGQSSRDDRISLR